MRLTTFCKLDSENVFKFIIYIVCPATNSPCPLLNHYSLRRCLLLFSFETVFWRSELICWSFCSREYGCNDM